MGDIFREVEEELRQEGYERLWRRYGKYAIGVAVMAVVAVAGWKGWESWQASQRHAEGLRFQTAVTLAQEGKMERAAAAFAELGAGTDSGYGLLSQFHRASLAAEAGDAAAAVEIYDAISADNRVSGSIRELATILAGLHALRVSSIPADAVEARIGPLTAAGKPFRHIALEILALSAYRSGASEKALANYRSIVDDAGAPAGIRGRASRMVNIFGNGGTAR